MRLLAGLCCITSRFPKDGSREPVPVLGTGAKGGSSCLFLFREKTEGGLGALDIGQALSFSNSANPAKGSRGPRAGDGERWANSPKVNHMGVADLRTRVDPRITQFSKLLVPKPGPAPCQPGPWRGVGGVQNSQQYSQ